jgi:hypothetical protein
VNFLTPPHYLFIGTCGSVKFHLTLIDRCVLKKAKEINGNYCLEADRANIYIYIYIYTEVPALDTSLEKLRFKIAEVQKQHKLVGRCHAYRKLALTTANVLFAQLTAKIFLCRAPLKRRTAKMSAPCVYRSRVSCRKRTAKRGLCRAPDRKRPANHLAHSKGRLSGSACATAGYTGFSWLSKPG